ncbi:MAG: helix-turn-helix transcriptional regulator [Clostridia bacterium]|nr:helix-turn-helix transcriptional regulator [Clostridia bacterium]
MPERNERLENYFLNDIFIQLEANNLLTNTEKDDIVRIAAVYFKKNIDKKISLENVASEVGVSVSGLISHLKKITGMTPIRYLTLLRIKKSETFLCHFDSPISEIAAACGFDNAYYFCNTFKKYNGVSPTAYRKKYKL